MGGQGIDLDFITSSSGIITGFGLILGDTDGQYRTTGPILVTGPNAYFPTGTFYYQDHFPLPDLYPNQISEGPYTLTITPEAATAPEPSSLILLGTGLLSAAGVARRKFRL